jgi:hypothetical protein
MAARKDTPLPHFINGRQIKISPTLKQKSRGGYKIPKLYSKMMTMNFVQTLPLNIQIFQGFFSFKYFPFCE